MNTIPKIIMWNDLINLPKSQLVDICISLEINSKGTIDELSSLIWGKINNDPERLSGTLERHNSFLLGGKKSVTWYSIERDDLKWLKDVLIDKNGFNPYENIKVIGRDEDCHDPILISAAKGQNEGEFILRYQMTTGNRRYVYGREINYLPEISFITVLYNEYRNFIEIRAKPEYAQKIAQIIAQQVSQEISLSQINIMSKYGNDVEKIADTLKGKFIESKPELMLEDFTPDKAKAVVEILSALDEFFSNDDFDLLRASLEGVKIRFGVGYENIPFTTLIINGMEKIGMASGSDLRGLPLYDSLSPFMQHQGGYIQFEVDEHGVKAEHTIKVGITTKSIQFLSKATEEAIRYVRDQLL